MTYLMTVLVTGVGVVSGSVGVRGVAVTVVFCVVVSVVLAVVTVAVFVLLSERPERYAEAVPLVPDCVNNLGINEAA